MSDDLEAAHGPLAEITSGGLYPFSLAMFVISACVSLAAFAYGVLLSILQPQVWQNSIIRVVVVAQLINCIRFIFRVLLTNVKINTESGCRAVMFLSDATSLLPVNLCIHCVVYLHLVVIHKVPPDLRWPRVVALTVASALSVVPPSFALYLPARLAGAASFCAFGRIPTRKQYEFTLYSYAIWTYLPGVIGIASVVAIAAHVVRTRRATQRALQASVAYYGPSQSVPRTGHTGMLHRALLTIIWFPITPILSLWLDALLVTVAYYRRRTYLWLEYVNIVLLCLQSFLLGLALVVNPTMRAARAKQARERRLARGAARAHERILPPPPLAPDSPGV
ncbi:hypothetical protein LPJ61_003378 [Coemansia biformis]|uniref:Uncharacterized protein n=1 Tax=Coemansia biformis TaxID=1286918 RepID=A0A9W8CXR1_9FUNG|nr:hypothetical protein LPJ61_003378 [Coemansia biformis]